MSFFADQRDRDLAFAPQCEVKGHTAENGDNHVDDFGRQRVAPEDLLNRWIIPLENRLDYSGVGARASGFK